MSELTVIELLINISVKTCTEITFWFVSNCYILKLLYLIHSERKIDKNIIADTITNKNKLKWTENSISPRRLYQKYKILCKHNLCKC